MVSFSCEVCNDTVIKKKLDLHTRQCRGAYFTCIDCSTTFDGVAYRSHTTCISEAEKYEKALYKGKKAGKQQQPQQPQQTRKKQKIEEVVAMEVKPKEVRKVEEDSIVKYYRPDESLYKVIKRMHKTNKKSTKDILKSLTVVQRGDQYVLQHI